MIELNVKKDVFSKIKNMSDYDFTIYLKNRLSALVMELDMNSEDKLIRKRDEIQKRMTAIMEELKDLSEYCEKAEKDKAEMEEWIDRLDEENQKLLEELRQ